MDTIVIQGGFKLKGEIAVKGSKNSALAILAATILTSEDCLLHNVPKIGDVLTMIEILQSMGARVEWQGDNSLLVNTAKADPQKLNFDLVKKIRASLSLIGSLVSRFHSLKISTPGGCNIGSRPIEAHLTALKDFGCEIEMDENFFIITQKKTPPARVVLGEFSVTATEILLLTAVGSRVNTEIRIAAGGDYPVRDLCWMLQAMGAQIEGVGGPTLTITKASDALHGVEYTIAPDPVEAGTFIALAGASNSHLVIHNIVPEFMYLELAKFKEAGVRFELTRTGQQTEGHYEIFTLKILPTAKLTAIAKLHDMPGPGFIPDLLQPFAVMLTQAHGVSLIYDWMYDGRLKYVKELKRMGADMKVLDAHRVMIAGPTPLYGKTVTSYDLRAGATIIIAALVAEGESIIKNIHQVDRGYEDLVPRLQQLGAQVKRD